MSYITILRKIVRKFRNLSLYRLKKRGLQIGDNFQYEKNLLIDKIYPHLVSIGNNVIASANVTILAHDAGLKNIMGIVRIGHVIIGDNVFLGLGCTVLPNVKIGNNVIVGAGSIVSKDIPDNSVCAGVPARIICSMSDYKSRILDSAKRVPIYSMDLDPLRMKEIEKREQKEKLQFSFGIKKAVNYNKFNSLEK